jgi:hypothetical protein
MKDRFTHEARLERGRIRPQIRHEIYERDGYRCQYCDRQFEASQLTIDHLVPLALGGVDETVNYVTACAACNQQKAALPLPDFAATVKVSVEALPVHGDPIIDNERLPVQIRLVRKRVFDAIRRGELSVRGKQFQKKVEKAYRTAFWATAAGQTLEQEFPRLPGHARVMVPEIQTIARDEREYFLLIELAKSANTRNLIGHTLLAGMPIETVVRKLADNSPDEALRKRLQQAVRRFDTVIRSRASGSAPHAV